MPGQQGLRRHDRGHLRQKRATEPFRLGRQTTPLVVVEPKPPATKLFFEDPILFTKIVEGELLLLIHPATEISKNRNGSRTLCAFKANCRERRATVGNHCRFMQIQFPDHTRSGLRRNGRACSCKEHWGETGGTLGDKDKDKDKDKNKEIRVRTGKFTKQSWLGCAAATGVFAKGLAPQVKQKVFDGCREHWQNY